MKLVKTIKLAMLVCCQLFFVSCNDEGSLGLNLIPGDRLSIGGVDTFTVISTTVREDSLVTGYNPFLFAYASSHQLGALNSAVFGKTECGFVSQIDIPRDNIDFGTSTSLDSIVLSLSYADVYGDTLDQFEVSVYELDEELFGDSLYYSNRSYAKKANVLAQVTVSPRPSTSVQYYDPESDTTTIIDSLPFRKSQLRIKLDPALGQRLLDASATNDLASSEAFKTFFKGLYVEAKSPANLGAVVNFELLSIFTNLSLYYTETDTGKRARRFNFIINNGAVRANHYKHDYTASQVEIDLGISNPPSGNSYLQGLAGLKTKIELPYFKEVNDGKKLVINKASLVFKITNSIANFDPPLAVVLLGADSLGGNLLLPFQTEQGGAYDEANKEFRLNVTAVTQALFTTEEFYGFYLVSTNSSVRAWQAELGTSTHPTKPLRLEVSFTEIP